MRITKISINGFGLFDDRFELDVPTDVALVVGDNETGKSTILSAVGAILFGLASESEKEAFAPYGHPMPRSGSLEFEAKGEPHRLSRDFASNNARMELLGQSGRVLFDGSAKPGGRTDEKEAYDALMRELLGIESRDVFENSVMTEQSGLRPKMASVVRRIVSGSSSADYAIVLDDLKKVCEELSMELPWKPGSARKLRRIELLQKDIRDKEKSLSEAGEIDRVIDEAGQRLSEVESELHETEKSITNQEAWREALASFARALKEKNGLERQMNEYRKKIRQIETLTGGLRSCSERIETEYSQYASLPAEAEADVAGCIRMKESEERLKERYGTIGADTLSLSSFMLSHLSLSRIFAGLLLIGFGAAFVGGGWRIAIVLSGSIILFWSILSDLFKLRSHRSIHQGKLSELKTQMENLAVEIEATHQRYPRLRDADLDEFQKKISELRLLQAEKSEKEAALGQHESLDEIENRYNQIGNELVLANNELEKLRSQRPSLNDIEREGRIGAEAEKVGAEISTLEKRRRDLAEERKVLDRRLAAAEAKETVSVEALEDEIEDLKSGLDRLKQSRDAHLLAIKTIDEAVSEFRASHLSRIRDKTTELLTRITGSPCRIELDESLEPLGLERDGKLFRMEQLSQGVRDQLHFALRLAAVEEISGEAHLPMFLDDPFVNFDDGRLESVLRMLDEICGSHQVLLFTHDRQLCEWRKPARVLER